MLRETKISSGLRMAFPNPLEKCSFKEICRVPPAGESNMLIHDAEYNDPQTPYKGTRFGDRSYP